MSDKLILNKDGTIRMRDKSGTLRDVPPSAYHEAVSYGMRPQTKAEFVEASLEKRFGDRSAEAAVIGAVSGITLGASDVAARVLAPDYGADEIKERNAGAALAGDIVGTVGSAITGTGAIGAVGRLGAKAGAKAGAVVAKQAGKQLAKSGAKAAARKGIPGAVSRGAVQAGEAVLPAAQKVTSAATRGAVEGAIIGASHEGADVLYRPGYDAEDFFERAAHGAVIGGVTGAVFDGAVSGVMAGITEPVKLIAKKAGLSRVGELAASKRALMVAEKNVMQARKAEPETVGRFMDLREQRLTFKRAKDEATALRKRTKSAQKKAQLSDEIQEARDRVEQIDRKLKRPEFAGLSSTSGVVKDAHRKALKLRVQVGNDIAANAAGVNRMISLAGGATAVVALGGDAFTGLVGGQAARTMVNSAAKFAGTTGIDKVVNKLMPHGVSKKLDKFQELAEHDQLFGIRKALGSRYAGALKGKNRTTKITLPSGEEVLPNHYVHPRQLRGEVAADLLASAANYTAGVRSSAARALGVGQRLIRYAPKSAAVYAMSPKDLDDFAESVHAIEPDDLSEVASAIAAGGEPNETPSDPLAGPKAGIDRIKQRIPLPEPGEPLTTSHRLELRDRGSIQVDPLSIYDRIADGTATVAMMDQLAHTSPALRAHVKEMAEDIIGAYGAAGIGIDHRTKQSLTLMISGQMDTEGAFLFQGDGAQKENAKEIQIANLKADTSAKFASSAQKLERTKLS